MIVILFVAAALALECRWACDDPPCQAECTPVCEKPVCAVTCDTPVVCRPPRCRIHCPIGVPDTELCPACETICDPPVCPPAATGCQMLCEAPTCAWSCKQPARCQRPRCELMCEKPACEAVAASASVGAPLAALGASIAFALST